MAQEHCYAASLFLYRLTHPPSHKFGQTSPLKRTAGLEPSSLSPSIDKLQKAAKKHLDSFCFCAEDVKKTSVSASVDIITLSIQRKSKSLWSNIEEI